MPKHSFTAAQRYAIFTVHGERCYLCGRPVDLKSMEVDHVIPESLLESQDRLSQVLQQLGRSDDFSVNSYANWLPACSGCNNRKRKRVFSPAPIVVLELDRAEEKAARAEALEAKSAKQKDIAKALNTLERAADLGDLSRQEIETISALIPFHAQNRAPEVRSEPIHLTPLYHVLQDDGFRKMIKGPYGVGARPSGSSIDPSWDCPSCGSIAAWNGARCVICGEICDD